MVDFPVAPNVAWSRCWVCASGRLACVGGELLECDHCGHQEDVR